MTEQECIAKVREISRDLVQLEKRKEKAWEAYIYDLDTMRPVVHLLRQALRDIIETVKTCNETALDSNKFGEIRKCGLMLEKLSKLNARSHKMCR